VRIVSRGAQADFVLRAISLIDERRRLSVPVVIDPDLALTHLGDVKIYENRRVLPRAFLIHDVVTVPTDEDVLAAMRQPGFDPTHQAVLTFDDWEQVPVDSQPAPVVESGNSVAVLDYQPERVRVAATSDHPTLLVLTDSFYPGWHVTVDGRPVPLLRANYLFRAVALPAGPHEVVFRYEPASFRLGAAISLAALAIVLSGLFASIVLQRTNFRSVSIRFSAVPVDGNGQ
jgi:hypothetical protein